MRVDELRDLGRHRLPVVDQLALGDQLANPGADEVNAQHRAAALGGDDLGRATGLQDLALAVAGQVVDDLGGLDATIENDRGGDAHRRDIGVAVSHPGDAVVVNGRDRQLGEPLGDHDSLGEADVRQLRAGNEIADRGDRRDARPAVFVHGDEAAIGGHAGVLVPEAGRDRSSADGDQQQLGVERGAALEGDRDAGVGGFDALEPGTELVADAAPAERPLEQLGAGLVLGRQQVRQHLDDRHLGAERTPDARELDPDHAAAEDDRGRRHAVELESLIAGDHPLPVDVDPGQAPRLRAGGQDHVGALDQRVADLNLGGRDQPPLAVDDVDVPAADQPDQASPQPGDDLVLVAVDPGHIDALERGLDAERGAVPGVVGEFGRVQQRLGRDAPPVQAGPADLALLDERHALAEFGRAQRAGVTAAAAAENHNVVAGLVRHDELPFKSLLPTGARPRRPARPG